VLTRVSAIAMVNAIATDGVRRRLTRPSTAGTIPSRAIPYTRRDAMIMLISAVFPTANSAISAKRVGGNASPATLTTSSSGPVDSRSVSVSTSRDEVKATARYTTPVIASPPKSARPKSLRGSWHSSARLTESSKPSSA
jgi:hypothetical protein